MSEPVIGIVGAYGATGAVVARTLAAHVGYPLVLIGRNEDKLKALADSAGREVAIAAADVMDENAIAAVCRPCRIVVNCAGPSAQVLARVARAALACGAHYIDPGGVHRVFDELTARNQEIESKGLTFLLGAGYVPGLSEMLVRAIYEVHRGKDTTPCKVRLFIVDRNEWSLTGFVDIIDEICRHPPEIGTYKRGVFHRRSMLTAWLRRRLPGHNGAEVLMPVRWSEIDEFIKEAQPLQAAVYFPMEPSIYFIGRFFARFFPKRLDIAARLAQAAFRSKARRQGSGGILYAEAAGRDGRQPLRWLIEVPGGRHYERTGQVAALAAALVADGTIPHRGVRYLAHAVDPHDFIVRLLFWGVETIDLSSGSPNQLEPRSSARH